MFGFLNCNKPIGFTSRDLVNVVQGRLRGKRVKVGHCGTLDPLADGVLVLGVGSAAKLVPYVHQLPKTYRGQFRLGAESPTGDLEIEPTLHPTHPVPTEADLLEACVKFQGMIRQKPPAYSAIKINGKRAYDLARQGRDVEVPVRTVQIHRLELIRYQYPTMELEITCSTGTYIRTLGIDLAESVGTVAVMTGLTRSAVGDFLERDSLSVDRLKSEPIETLLSPATSGVSHLASIQVTEEGIRRIGHGQCLPLPPELAEESSVAALSTSHGLCAILEPKGDRLCPKRVFVRRDARSSD